MIKNLYYLSKKNFFNIFIFLQINFFLYGDWGLGIGDWGLGIGDWEIGRASCRERV